MKKKSIDSTRESNQSSKTKSNVDTISFSTLSNLSPDEKAKVTRLVDRLVNLAKEHDQTLKILSFERSSKIEEIKSISEKYREEINLLSEKLSHAEADKISAQTKRGLAVGLLALYQDKINYFLTHFDKLKREKFQSDSAAQSYKDRIGQLESIVESQKNLIDSLNVQVDNLNKLECDKKTLEKECIFNRNVILEKDMIIELKESDTLSLKNELNELKTNNLNNETEFKIIESNYLDRINELELENKSLQEFKSSMIISMESKPEKDNDDDDDDDDTHVREINPMVAEYISEPKPIVNPPAFYDDIEPKIYTRKTTDDMSSFGKKDCAESSNTYSYSFPESSQVNSLEFIRSDQVSVISNKSHNTSIKESFPNMISDALDKIVNKTNELDMNIKNIDKKIDKKMKKKKKIPKAVNHNVNNDSISNVRYASKKNDEKVTLKIFQPDQIRNKSLERNSNNKNPIPILITNPINKRMKEDFTKSHHLIKINPTFQKKTLFYLVKLTTNLY